MDLYVVRVSMLLGLASVLFGSLCCASSNIAWSRIRSVWVSMLFEFLCRLVSHPFCMGLYAVRVSISLDAYVTSVCIGLYVVLVSMSLGLTPVLYGSLCCPSFYVNWSHFRYVWFSMFSKFLCHLISLPFCMGVYFVRFSMSLNFTSVLYVLLCCPSF
jgi:hypothetical protein